jgi:hypothetical protein
MQPLSRNAVTKERRFMAQVLTFIALALGLAWLWWRRESLFSRAHVRVSLRLDRSAPGAHLIWDIVNAGERPITISKLVMSGPRGEHSSVTLEHARDIRPGEHLVFPIDVDWSLLAARSLAAVDPQGHEHEAPARQLKAVQDHLRQMIDRRVYTRSAREFLFGAADLAFGVVILGLGFFMLMWVIATG